MPDLAVGIDASDQRAARLLNVATELVTRVRDDDPAAVHRTIRLLDPEDHIGVTVLLAAMVPDDHTTTDLLAWYLNPKGQAV